MLARGTGSAGRLRHLDETPVLASGRGARCTDLDGNTYIDYFLAFGPLFLGHRPQPVLDAVMAHLAGDAIIAGGPHALEAELARLIVETVPCAERVVLSTTGSEAVQVAIRIARAKTRRRTVLKFDGHYHGWMEPVNVNALGTVPVAGPPPLELVPSVAAAGVPGEVIVCPWNDVAALEAMLTRFGDEIACVIMEPVPCNFGTFLPAPGYLEACRDLCRRHGVVLIFDEVVTGFRLALGGAQELLGVTPDMAVFAKAIGSGFTIAAVAGTAEAMAPRGRRPGVHRRYLQRRGARRRRRRSRRSPTCATTPEIYDRVDLLGRRLADQVNERRDDAPACRSTRVRSAASSSCSGGRAARSATTPTRAPAIRRPWRA